MTEPNHSPDALMPPEMAAKAEALGVKKAGLDAMAMFALAVLAGAFISMGAVFSTTVMADPDLSFGWQRLLGGLVFSVGLVLVVVGGAELFTGNTLIIMAWAGRRVSTGALLRNWGVVYAGNYIGALATAVLVFLAGHYLLGNGAVGRYVARLAEAKCEADFLSLFARGVLGNAMVCIAVWLSFSARSTTDRVLSVVPPITMFVAAGFEHCVANMYYIPMGLLIKHFAAEEIAAGPLANLTVANFGYNLAAVTIGNIVGGALLVGIVYWFIYLRPRRASP